jgi:hypothetical protein
MAGPDAGIQSLMGDLLDWKIATHDHHHLLQCYHLHLNL